MTLFLILQLLPHLEPPGALILVEHSTKTLISYLTAFYFT